MSSVARLYCLAHAGGGATTFSQWPGIFSAANVEVRIVEYPGRETRSNEAPISNAAQLVEELGAIWPEDQEDSPYMIYGHSMGAMVAFELTALLERQKRRPPGSLALGACSAPSARSRLSSIHKLEDREFIAELEKRYNHLPSQLLNDATALEYYLPILRADFRAVETYDWRHAQPIAVPLVLFIGTRDTLICEDDIQGWRNFGKVGLEIQQIDGDHFFHRTKSSAIAPILISRVMKFSDLKR